MERMDQKFISYINQTLGFIFVIPMIVSENRVVDFFLAGRMAGNLQQENE